MTLRPVFEPIYYQLYTKEDLRNIDVTKNYILMNDIDLENEPWIPLELPAFSDSYLSLDGNGFKIKNLILENVTINATSNKSTVYAGALYGFAKDELVIENVQVLNLNINLDLSGQYAYVGGLIGRTNYAVDFKYVYTQGSINVNSNGYLYASGILGNADGVTKYLFLRSNVNLNI